MPLKEKRQIRPYKLTTRIKFRNLIFVQKPHLSNVGQCVVAYDRIAGSNQLFVKRFVQVQEVFRQNARLKPQIHSQLYIE